MRGAADLTALGRTTRSSSSSVVVSSCDGYWVRRGVTDGRTDNGVSGAAPMEGDCACD